MPEKGTRRGRVDHVIVLDGTFSSLKTGEMSNAGLAFHLMCEGGRNARRTLYYEEGIQWQGWRRGLDVVQGIGIDGQICRPMAIWPAITAKGTGSSCSAIPAGRLPSAHLPG